MKDLARYAAILVLIIFCVVRIAEVNEELPSGAQQAVSGIVHALSVTDVDHVWELDSLRRMALRKLRKDYEKGSFVPPTWFLTEMDKLSDASVTEAHQILDAASKKLFEQQSGYHFSAGIKVLEEAKNHKPEPKPENEVCPDCGGTGKVGDGRVWTDCLSCKEEADKPAVDPADTGSAVSGGGRVSRNRLFQGRILKRLFGK